jgi:uncharacterized membrane protein
MRFLVSFTLVLIPTRVGVGRFLHHKAALHNFDDPICLNIKVLVGGFKHVLFSIIYGIILPNLLICFKMVKTTNQIIYIYIICCICVNMNCVYQYTSYIMFFSGVGCAVGLLTFSHRQC